MKKTHVSLLLAILLLVCSVLTLSACTTPGAGGEGEGEGGGETITIYQGQTLYNASTKVVFITDGRASSQAASAAIMEEVDRMAANGKKPVAGTVADAPADYEVIVGYVPQRAISKRAYELLERIDSKSPISEARYLIYANGGTIAIAYDENYYSDIQVVDVAVEKLLKSYFYNKSSALLEYGVIYSGIENLIDLQAQKDNATVNAMWKEIESSISKEAYYGLRTYYGMFTKDITTWFANLYDPGLGGFYATATGRDEINIFPDVEATAQILEFIRDSGMVDGLEGGIAENLPQIVRSQLIWYVKSLQDENGYFYLSQLGKDFLDSDAGIARRESDRLYALSILDILGAKPTYDSYNVKGDGLTADEYWASTGYNESLKPALPEYVEIPDEGEGTEEDGTTTASLTSSVATAVSKAVSVADISFTPVVNVSKYLGSHGTFSSYVYALPFKTNVALALEQIKYDLPLIKLKSDEMGRYQTDPDEGLAEDELPGYEGQTYLEILFDGIASQANAMGLYGEGYKNDGKDETIGAEMENAFLFNEVIKLYNSEGAYFPRAAAAARGMFTCLSGFETVDENSDITLVYGLWEILQALNENVEKYATAEQKAAFEVAYKKVVDDLGGQVGTVNYARQSSFKKLGGSYSHLTSGCLSTHAAGLVVGTGEENEGDVDAMKYAITGMAKMMCDAYGVDYVPTYTQADWLRFIDSLLALDPVIKYDRDLYKEPPILVFDFDTIPKSFFKVTSGGAEFEYDPVEVYKNGALYTGEFDNVLYVNKLTAGAQVIVHCTDALIQDPAATMTVFNIDVCIEEVGRDSQIEVSIYDQAYGSMAYHPILFLLQQGGPTKGSSITLVTYHNKASKDKVTLKPTVGEWFNLRVEYYEATTLDNIRIKYYVNDELVLCTNNIYSPEMCAGGMPIVMAEKINYVGFKMNMALTGIFYYDNVYLHQTTQKLDDGTLGIPQSYLDSMNTSQSEGTK